MDANGAWYLLCNGCDSQVAVEVSVGTNRIYVKPRNADCRVVTKPDEIGVFVEATCPKCAPKVKTVDDKGIVNYERTFVCNLDDGTNFTFKFFQDEIWVEPQELVGKTERQCWAVKQSRDVDYLRS